MPNLEDFEELDVRLGKMVRVDDFWGTCKLNYKLVIFG